MTRTPALQYSNDSSDYNAQTFFDSKPAPPPSSSPPPPPPLNHATKNSHDDDDPSHRSHRLQGMAEEPADDPTYAHPPSVHEDRAA